MLPSGDQTAPEDYYADAGDRGLAVQADVSDPALRKRSAPRILTAQADARAFLNERAKGDCLGKAPIHRHFARSHFSATRQLPDHFRVDMKAFGHKRDLL